MRVLTVDCVTFSRAAAATKLPVVITSMNVRASSTCIFPPSIDQIDINGRFNSFVK
jgi:hypothetical protein